MIGLRFGKLVVLEEAGQDKYTSRLYLCQCDCGERSVKAGWLMRRGSTTSCGCVQRSVLGDASRTHGARKTRAYSIWHNMKTRCDNPNSRYFKDYGGRGIKICDRWRDFSAFLEDLGQPPDGMTLDRIDNDRGYEPGNVRWASKKDQANNRRSSRVIEHGGERLTLQQWANRTGIKRATIAQRLDRGWPAAKALAP